MLHREDQRHDRYDGEATMSAGEQDKRPVQDKEGVSEDAGAIEGYDLRPGEDEETVQPKQPEDPPEELEEERRG
jgi:hypothetical protein